MSTIATAPTTMPSGPTSSAAVRRHPVRRATLASGAVAAVITTAVAAAAQAVDVPLAIDGETIPLGGFAQLTMIGAVLGGLIAAALNRYSAEPRRWFSWTAVVLTVLSCVPSVAFPPDVATKATLVATHVIAAAIIIPSLSRQIGR